MSEDNTAQQHYANAAERAAVAQIAPAHNDAAPITLQLLSQPDGSVLLLSLDNLNANTPHAAVARTLVRFCDGLFETGLPVRIHLQLQEFLR